MVFAPGLEDEKNLWVDSVEYAWEIRGRFEDQLYADTELWAHRQYSGPRGMGDNAFHWMWKLIVDEQEPDFRFLEIGVFKGQVPSLIRFLADRTGRKADIYGVTMLSSFGGKNTTHPEGDYLAAIKEMHDHFEQPMPTLIVGDSTSDVVHERVKLLGLLDIVYVDGCHDYDYVAQDLVFYAPLVRTGGYLVTDDSACNLKQPWGFFQGIQDVTRAVLTFIATDPHWEHVFTVCHNRVWRKVE